MPIYTNTNIQGERERESPLVLVRILGLYETHAIEEAVGECATCIPTLAGPTLPQCLQNALLLVRIAGYMGHMLLKRACHIAL